MEHVICVFQTQCFNTQRRKSSRSEDHQELGEIQRSSQTGDQRAGEDQRGRAGQQTVSGLRRCYSSDACLSDASHLCASCLSSHCVQMLDWFNYYGHVCISFELLARSTFGCMKANSFLPYPMNQIRHMAHQICHAVSCESNMHHINGTSLLFFFSRTSGSMSVTTVSRLLQSRPTDAAANKPGGYSGADCYLERIFFLSSC